MRSEDDRRGAYVTEASGEQHALWCPLLGDLTVEQCYSVSIRLFERAVIKLALGPAKQNQIRSALVRLFFCDAQHTLSWRAKQCAGVFDHESQTRVQIRRDAIVHSC